VDPQSDNLLCLVGCHLSRGFPALPRQILLQTQTIAERKPVRRSKRFFSCILLVWQGWSIMVRFSRWWYNAVVFLYWVGHSCLVLPCRTRYRTVSWFCNCPGNLWQSRSHGSRPSFCPQSLVLVCLLHLLLFICSFCGTSYVHCILLSLLLFCFCYGNVFSFSHLPWCICNGFLRWRQFFFLLDAWVMDSVVL